MCRLLEKRLPHPSQDLLPTHHKSTALDFSQTAIAIAKENATKNKVAIEFLEHDILNTSSLPEKYDIIVSNPPYVRNLEKTEIKKNVLAYEPASALFVDDANPLVFYEKICALADQGRAHPQPPRPHSRLAGLRGRGGDRAQRRREQGGRPPGAHPRG